MIKATKSALFETGFNLYLTPLIRFSFSRLLGQGVKAIPQKPVLFIANHSSWWDGLVFFYLNRTIWHHDIHMMMHEKGLKKYSYFRYLGAFSINREKPKEILTSLQYAEALLKQGKSVILFPQGDEFHLEKRPLTFQSGAAYLMEKCPEVSVVPMSFYYSFGHQQKPELWVRQHAVISNEEIAQLTRKEKTLYLQQLCTEQLDHLKSAVISENSEAFQSLGKRRS
ncbi:lysophospholipid acyltransferase family protein [Planococcus donghaensis]|uniref:Acyl-phosphate glycerol 3-phosphate acyltransferase n=1 Tax=Planococcus donghaensis TaxID=414778 RepID=A0A1C7EDN8_9BACL|nr:lysophospholipid acyltransferase family protein [Planococcus donghaensis]ANU22143.1 acyl-phosphate glycerol 3-phosphate acyltransferase [Planococcus donghaensis]